MSQRTEPATGGIVGSSWAFVALLIVASAANLNLAVAGVALPEIGLAFDAGQTSLDLVAVGYPLGLAMSVLYAGALGDRYGRKLMLIAGMIGSVAASFAAAAAPSIEVLIVARVAGGLAAGMAFPTTLSLTMALWSGEDRNRKVALWSGVGAAMVGVGVFITGWLLVDFYWGSTFLLTVPVALVGLVMAIVFVPSHVGESADPVDHLGGALSVVLVASLILAINFAAAPTRHGIAIGCGIVAVASGVAFYVRQKRAPAPLFNIEIARRRIFWVAAISGIIVFGAFQGAMYIAILFLQNVLSYSPFESGLATLPVATSALLSAPFASRLTAARGSRVTLLSGFASLGIGFTLMLGTWHVGVPYGWVGLALVFVGVGAGLAGAPAAASLANSVPVERAGMASGTSDLQRDLGGAIVQSAMGAVLTLGYAETMVASISNLPNATDLVGQVKVQLEKSFAGAEEVAALFPSYSEQIIVAARDAFLAGSDLAYWIGIASVVIGLVLVSFAFPRRSREALLISNYQALDQEPSRDTLPES